MAFLQKTWWASLLTPVTVFIIGFTASGLAAYQFARVANEKDQERVVHIFGQAQDSIEARLETYIAMLRAGAGLVSSRDGVVSREEFRLFVDQLQLPERYPGVQGIGFSARLTNGAGDPRAALAAFGVPDLELTPEGEREEVHAIVHLEPLDRRNQAALGYDMFSEEVRRTAMERARDTGEAASSGRVQLVQEIDEQVQAGFLIYEPVYRGGKTPTTVEERRRRLIGFVYAPFRADDLMRGIFGMRPRQRVDVEIYDGEIRPETLLHRSPGFSADAPWHQDDRRIYVAGQPWVIRFSTRPEFQYSSSRDLIPYVFLSGLLATLILAALTGAQVRAKQRADHAARAAEQTARKLEVLHATASRFSAELDPERLMQEIADAGRVLCGAEVGVFFSECSASDSSKAQTLFTVSGRRRDELARLATLKQTDVFGTAARGEASVVRSADITTDLRFRKDAANGALPFEDGTMRSYLAVPVVSRSGEVLGGLLFGHPDAGIFTEEAQRSIVALAGHAAIAIDNSRLFKASQEEIVARKKIEEHQKFLLDELNHRVKNTLATVQSIAAQTMRSSPDPAAFRNAFEARLIALSAAHDLLSRENWRGVMLRDLVRRELAPYGLDDRSRVSIEGERVWLPARISVPLGMAIHELATNAARHGSLTSPKGRVDVRWTCSETPAGLALSLTWQESGGPAVATPLRRGFGTRMIERGLEHDLRGETKLYFEPKGLRCEIKAQIPAHQAVA